MCLISKFFTFESGIFSNLEQFTQIQNYPVYWNEVN